MNFLICWLPPIQWHNGEFSWRLLYGNRIDFYIVDLWLPSNLKLHFPSYSLWLEQEWKPMKRLLKSTSQCLRFNWIRSQSFIFLNIVYRLRINFIRFHLVLDTVRKLFNIGIIWCLQRNIENTRKYCMGSRLINYWPKKGFTY